jgi:hypothetical protein
VFPYSVKGSSSKLSIKSKSGVFSFFGGSEIGIAEGCGGFGKDSGLAIWNSFSKRFSSSGFQVYLLEFGLRFFLLLEPKDARMILLKLR